MQGKDTLPITTNAHVLQVANISHGQTTILMQKKKLQQSSEKPEKCLQGKKKWQYMQKKRTGILELVQNNNAEVESKCWTTAN